MKAAAIGLVAMTASGCSWILQDALPSSYDKRSLPVCDTSKALPTIDVVLAGLNLLDILAAAGSDVASRDKTAYIIGGVIGGLVYTLSASDGFGEADRCRAAMQQWQDTEGTERAKRQLREAEQLEELRRAKQPKSPPDVVAKPRGFFCASSQAQPTVSACAREKSACEQARGVAIGAVPDLATCTLVETAQCFDAGSGRDEERCAATEAACKAQRDAALATTPDTTIGECAETK